MSAVIDKRKEVEVVKDDNENVEMTEADQPVWTIVSRSVVILTLTLSRSSKFGSEFRKPELRPEAWGPRSEVRSSA